ncbi:MAG: pyridoxamine 5'-phosphate oxidase [bacterium]|nr:pyridoxamine 5'-phosphate oxidase [bacterium]
MSFIDISTIREEYTRQALSEKDVASNPIDQFKKWFEEAMNSEVYVSNAMSLGTADKSGQPSVRIVLLKGIDEKGFKFFTNYESSKGQQLMDNPKAAATLFWPELERQIRIEGAIEKLTHQESEKYFHSRPIGSQIGAWSSPQSKKIESRGELEDKEALFKEKFDGLEKIPKPDHWGGYSIVPNSIEFWQGRENRLHDRILYELKDGNWVTSRLAP